jgi:hypothetical protein
MLYNDVMKTCSYGGATCATLRNISRNITFALSTSSPEQIMIELYNCAQTFFVML